MGSKIFAIIVTLMVAAVTITGLIILGSPLTERERRFDNQRVSDLRSISSAVDLYFTRTGHLPTTIDDLLKPDIARLYDIASTTDPETSAPYEYSVMSKTTYKLCATFTHADNTKPTEMSRDLSGYFYRNNRAWEHPAGHKCFDILTPQPKKE